MLLFYLLSRLPFLTSLPIFNDEAIYLDWASVIGRNFSRWTIPLIMDGKQPGHVLLLALLTKLPYDPLILGRILSVAAGCITFLTSLRILKKVMPEFPTWIAAIIFSFSPYLLFFDRMALAESLITAASIILLFLIIKAHEKQRELKFAITHQLTYGIALGAIFGIGWWIKSSILLVLPLLLFTHLTILLTAIGTLFVFLLPIILNPELQRLVSTQQRYILSFQELLRVPLLLWLTNITHALVWLAVYTTPVIFVLFCIGIVSAWRKPEWRMVIVWTLFPIFAGSILASGFTARYMAMVVPAYLIGVIRGIGVVREKYGKKTLALLVVPVVWSVILIVSPLTYYQSLAWAPSAQKDFSQYVTSWTSGYGVSDAITWLEKRSATSPIAVGIRQDSGNPEDAAVLYLSGKPNITFFSVSNPPDLVEVYKKTKGLPTYFISRGNQKAGLDPYLTEVIRFKKPLDEEFVGIYEIRLP